MQVEAARDRLLVRFGDRFAVAEAERLAEVVSALAPPPEIILDFTEVRRFEEAAIAPLTACLERLADVQVHMLGLTIHEARVLGYFGFKLAPRAAVSDDEEESATQAPAAPADRAGP